MNIIGYKKIIFQKDPSSPGRLSECFCPALPLGVLVSDYLKRVMLHFIRINLNECQQSQLNGND